jgi:glycosyltransferase involved in cell wall biosynthesis
MGGMAGSPPRRPGRRGIMPVWDISMTRAEKTPGDTFRILFWGTYDLSKPRNRILRDGLRQSGVQVDECHASIWEGIRDKGVISGWQQAARLAKTLFAYPRLILGFLKAPRPDVVLVGYLGQIDVLVLWPFARLRRVPVAWDQFLSLYNTVVEDRGGLSRRHPLTLALYALEWLACRSVDRVVMDTRAHAAYVRQLYRLEPGRVASVWVGVEDASFPPPPEQRPRSADRTTVLFYGQLIPLHGVDTIVAAARLLREERFRFVLIGSGQEEGRLRQLLDEARLQHLEWIPWVAYEDLAGWIHRADVCLGIFGATAKAALVIPNKVFQILAARRPLITRDSPAIRELLGEGQVGVTLVPPADAEALADAIRRVAEGAQGPSPQVADLGTRIGAEAIGEQALAVLRSVAGSVSRS